MKILITDDSIFVRQYLKTCILETVPETELAFASTGEEALEIYNRQKFDLIITDLLMPGISGYDLIKKIRERDRDIKIIVLTADIQKAVREEIEELNITAFLNKPVTRENISETIANYLKD